MPVFIVRFSKECEFQILVQAERAQDVSEAIPKALKEINRGQWETGEDDEWTASPPRLVDHPCKPNHGIKDKIIVAIEDLRAAHMEGP